MSCHVHKLVLIAAFVVGIEIAPAQTEIRRVGNDRSPGRSTEKPVTPPATNRPEKSNTYPALPTYDLVQIVVIFNVPNGPKQVFHLQLQRGTKMSEALAHFESRFEQVFPGGQVWIHLARRAEGGNTILIPVDYAADHTNASTNFTLLPGDQIHVHKREKMESDGGILGKVYGPLDNAVGAPFRDWCQDRLGWNPARPFGGFFQNLGTNWTGKSRRGPSVLVPGGS
ncbi:MAG: hypothetical protein ACFCD0_27620 [Gemmataceae bacterium]